MPLRLFRCSLACLTAASAAFAFTAVTASADESKDGFDDNDGIHASSAKFGGASPVEDAHTVRHWSGQTTNPKDGVTYRYNMVGVDPSSGRSATIGVDIIAVDITVGEASFNGTENVQALLASPIFQQGDYSTTSAATNARGGQGGGGGLSAGNSGVQLLDATMRAQFNKVGTGYHLFLAPKVRPPITINVPNTTVPPVLGTTLTRNGITYADLDNDWFKSTLQDQVHSLHLNPSRLALFLTTNVVLFHDQNPLHCCVIGSHGADDLPTATSDSEDPDDGHQKVHTFVWSSWLTAGFLPLWAIQDIHGVSHEIVEWATNPFVNNIVQAYRSPLAPPTAACSNMLETGDPVTGIGFALSVGGRTYHPEDEVLLPWFMRTAPNTTSQPGQDPAKNPNVGRYTFMGDLNPFWSRFNHPPGTC